MFAPPNIDFKKPNTNPTLDAETSDFELPFYKNVDYFSSIDNFVGFVKAVEKMTRGSDFYSRYVKFIKEDVGLRHCQVLGNIEEEFDDKGPKKGGILEMHHGPILTLFDYAAIMTDWMLIKKKKINSFIVTDLLLEEHFNNNIQVVMLSKTVHELVHDNHIFVNLNSGFGDLDGFLKKYGEGLQVDHVRKINEYIEKSKQFDSFDNNVLNLAGAVRKWKRDNGED